MIINAKVDATDSLIKIEEQLLVVGSEETLDIFSLWMIIEDMSKSLTFTSKNITIVEKMKSALNIQNTRLFKEAWTLWKPKVAKSEAQYLVQRELRELIQVFSVKMDSSKSNNSTYFSYYPGLVDSVNNKMDFKVQDVLCDLSQMLDSILDGIIPDLVTETLTKIRSSVVHEEIEIDAIEDIISNELSNTFEFRQKYLSALLPLLLAHLKQDLTYRSVMTWLVGKVIFFL